MDRTVHCVLINHSHVNEVQTITQIFFPNRSFAFDDDSAVIHPGFTVVSRLCTGEAYGSLYRDGNLLSTRCTRPGGFITIKRAVMLSLFHALKEAIDAYTPWGALTGIRPTKLVRQWMDEGLTGEEIIRALIDPFCCMEHKARLALEVAETEEKLTKSIQGVGLYISVPFCPSRCLYCSFNTDYYVDHEQYIKALCIECVQKAEMARDLNREITSVYIGGGTPTVLPPALLSRLLETVAKVFPLSESIEFTVEAGRPDSLTRENLRILNGFGVNRIAVNPQSLNDRTLKLIGRSHTAADFFYAFDMARSAGFGCVNTDIIAGLPGENESDMAYTLEKLIPLAPENITVHTLAVKRASVLNENLSEYENGADHPLPQARMVEAMLSLAREACDKAGLYPYYLYRQKNMVGLLENVGYTRPGFACMYNVGMMAETQTILGIGAAAVCKFVDGTKVERTFNVKNPKLYVERMIASC